MSYSVYIHVNTVNDKKYVGITMKDINRRWQNGNGYRNNKHFSDAIKKYGWDSFDHYVVDVATPEEMYDLEKFYIDYYHTTDPEKGYNVSKGGDKGHYLGKDCWTKDYLKKYYDENREVFNLRCKKYYETHKDKEKERKKKYRELHKEEVRKYNAKYRAEHLESERNRCRLYRLSKKNNS